jgi:imidazolonepropionase-like amidohydrolase
VRNDCCGPRLSRSGGLYQEFELLRDAGLTPREILRMTGETAARALRRSDVGVIEAGRRAALVLLRADPAADMSNTREIVWVMQQGDVLSYGPARFKAESPRR